MSTASVGVTMSIRVSGELVTFTVKVAVEGTRREPGPDNVHSTQPPGRVEGDLLLAASGKKYEELQASIEQSLLPELGGNVSVDDVVVKEGSIEIFVAVT